MSTSESSLGLIQDDAPSAYPDGPSLVRVEQSKPLTTIGFEPVDHIVIVHCPPVEKKSASGLDLSQVESLDANLPRVGTVVALGRDAKWRFNLGDQVLVKRYCGTQLAIDGDDNYWALKLNAYTDEVLGRFPTRTVDTTPRGDSLGA